MTPRPRILAAIAACLAFSASAATTPFSADGNAVIVGGNRAAAVAQATRAAEVQAVAEALKKVGGAEDQSESLLEEHRDAILKSSQAGRDSVDGNIVTVRVTASVDTGALAKLAGASGKPQAASGGGGSGTGKRVLILATEQLGPKEILAWTDFAFAVGPGSASASSKTHLMQLVDESGSLEAALADGFSSAGFDVIDPKVLRGKLQKPGVEMVDLTNTQAESIASKADADIVLVVKGKANLQHHEALAEAGMHSGGANVVARAIRVRDGKVLASTTQQAAKVHIDIETAQLLAMNEAAKLAASELTRKLNAD
jgi:hypothetical protein